jgi:hypothetical protein
MFIDLINPPTPLPTPTPIIVNTVPNEPLEQWTVMKRLRNGCYVCIKPNEDFAFTICPDEPFVGASNYQLNFPPKRPLVVVREYSCGMVIVYDPLGKYFILDIDNVPLECELRYPKKYTSKPASSIKYHLDNL